MLSMEGIIFSWFKTSVYVCVCAHRNQRMRQNASFIERSVTEHGKRALKECITPQSHV